MPSVLLQWRKKVHGVRKICQIIIDDVRQYFTFFFRKCYRRENYLIFIGVQITKARFYLIQNIRSVSSHIPDL